jgi:hypothetical protein
VVGNLERLSTWRAQRASSLNPERYSLVNLQYLLGSLGLSAPWADLITYAAVSLAALAMIALFRSPDSRSELLPLAIVATLTLLVTYHRYYDAVVLALPIAWAMAAWRTPQRRLGVLSLVLCANFILPVQTALHDLEQRQIVPSALTDGVIWKTVLMTSVWALILLAAVLIVAAAGASRDLPGTTTADRSGKRPPARWLADR